VGAAETVGTTRLRVSVISPRGAPHHLGDDWSEWRVGGAVAIAHRDDETLIMDAIPTRLCPNCGTTARFLANVSRESHANYHRCDHCGVVWAQDRKDPHKPPFIVQSAKNALVKKATRG
jgi:predicted RNA-binding Zn-ribbon protein involved in translation (DUF1610 family)